MVAARGCGALSVLAPPVLLHCRAQALRAIADKLTATPDMMTAAMHSSALDFLMNRLPPHPKQLPQRGPAPTMSDKVCVRACMHV